MPGYAATAEVPRPQPAPHKFEVLGVRVDAVQIPEMIRRLEQWIAEGPRGRYVTLSNVHAIMEAQSQPAFKQVLNQAASVCPDGMPLVWMGRRAGYALPRRVYGPDLLWDFCRATERQGYSHFFYGGGPGIADRLAKELKARFPGVRVAGCYSPPFRPLSAEEDAAVVRMINDAAPDLLWVGLGCPKQEFWMHEHAGRLRVPVMLGVGQAFDIYAGSLPQAPRWMREHGLEWLFPPVPGAAAAGKEISRIQQQVCGLTWLPLAVSLTDTDRVNLLRSLDLLLLAEPLAVLARLRLRALGVVLGQSVIFYGLPVVSLSPGSEIRIGSHVVLCSWSRYTALGVNHATIVRTLTREARLTIGDHVGISGGAICAAESVTIGAYTMLGANVTVADTDFHPLAALNRRYSGTGVETSPVVIGSNVFLGTGAVVLKGVHIGDNSVIGAGSVVTRDIPADVIAAGNPCRVIRTIEERIQQAS